MRVLIDECVDPRVKSLLTEHEALTVRDKGWDALEDGPLLALAQDEFDVLVTIDGNLEFQQNLAKLRIGLVVGHVPKNQLNHYQAIREELLRAIGRARPGLAVHVKAPSD